MAKSWSKRLRRGRLTSWLGRIEGVEKPALLVGIGILLYRVWRNEERRIDPQMGTLRAFKSRWRGAIDRMRRHFGDRAETANAASGSNSTTPSPPPPA